MVLYVTVLYGGWFLSVLCGAIFFGGMNSNIDENYLYYPRPLTLGCSTI